MVFGQISNLSSEARDTPGRSGVTEEELRADIELSSAAGIVRQ